ncbi:leucyl/phenylalanyl-tRNA--protein transferase [Silvimonas amylolytica]|uniref:Leucyl/phenylalanyl-tRNA--protein transferase n=1 Tax=Silvimonas amylolytica TaxID=449663 RepID=A0ABQ2PLA3_9NEIS|nr:leucyl/phenylalanyl-tRNA--protein transferase [Silvimonas amylolytica]GGP26155.1 leucyl/phenylalanyl-tRNA--protein transferase [Silvimonas amylolytica]
MIAWLDDSNRFPPLQHAMVEPNGLLAAGGDLSPQRLLAAYYQGIFPWYMPGEPILWWSPNPRMVLMPEKLHVPGSLAKTLRNKPYRVTFDLVFDEVINGCASPRRGENLTWISQEIRDGYGALYQLGYAHSAECWMDNELVGGLYGVAIGNMFYGESMFARRPDASKLAFVHLVRYLREHGFGMIDCQMHTEHLARFGAHEIDRDQFARKLGELVTAPRAPAHWQYDFHNPGS